MSADAVHSSVEDTLEIWGGTSARRDVSVASVASAKSSFQQQSLHEGGTVVIRGRVDKSRRDDFEGCRGDD